MMTLEVTTRIMEPLPDIQMELLPQLHPLKLERIKRHLTQRMLADFTCLGLSTIERAEAGKPLSFYVHSQLCQFFGKSSSELGLRYQVRV